MEHIEYLSGFEPPSVVVVADDEAVRDLLELMVELDPRFRLAGTASDGPGAAALVRRVAPAAVVLDLQLAGGDGMTVLSALRYCAPDAHIVALSEFPDPYTLGEVLRRGGDLYLDKAHVFAELLPALGVLCEHDYAAA